MQLRQLKHNRRQPPLAGANQTDWWRLVLICGATSAALLPFSAMRGTWQPQACSGPVTAASATHLHAEGRPLQAEHCGCHGPAARATGGGRGQRPRLLREHHAGRHCAGCQLVSVRIVDVQAGCLPAPSTLG